MSAKKAQTADQTASSEAVRSWSSLFAILTNILRNPALISIILYENRMRKAYEILEHLPDVLLFHYLDSAMSFYIR